MRESSKTAWELDSDLWGGVETMRTAGARRIPLLANEAWDKWRIRVNQARLYPAYKDSIASLAGRLRESNLSPAEDAPQALADWFWAQKPADLLHAVDIDGLRHGESYLLVDENIQHIPAPDMLEAWPESGRPTYIRFQRKITQPAGGEPVTIIYEMREINAVVEIAEYIDGKVKAARTVPAPLRCVRFEYSENQRPYFEQLAYLAAAYWNSASMQQHALGFSRFNIISGNDIPADIMTMGVGPSTMISLPEGSGLSVLEGGGAGIEAGERDLAELVRQMDAIGVGPMQADGLRQTATETNRDATVTDAPIKRLADMRLEAVNQVARYAAALLGLPAGDDVFYITGSNEFAPIQPGGVADLVQLFAAGVLDAQTVREAAVIAVPALRGVDPAEIAARIDAGAL
jgi:hypothetical protein